MGEDLSEGGNSALIKDDVEVVLLRLERARKAIQEICPILLDNLQKEQPRFIETERIYMEFMESLKGGEANEAHKASAETDVRSLISEAVQLLGKISSLIRANKAELVLASIRDQAIQMTALPSPPMGDVRTKDDMSPEQNFYFLLANSDLSLSDRSRFRSAQNR